jgi:hypothetical protein
MFIGARKPCPKQMNMDSMNIFEQEVRDDPKLLGENGEIPTYEWSSW